MQFRFGIFGIQNTPWIRPCTSSTRFFIRGNESLARSLRQPRQPRQPRQTCFINNYKLCVHSLCMMLKREYGTDLAHVWTERSIVCSTSVTSSSFQMQMASPCYALIGRSIVQPRAVGSTAMCCWRAIPHTITTASLRMKLNVDLEAY